MVRYCTIVTYDDLPFARVLAGSLRRQHPDAELDVLLLDPLCRPAEAGEDMHLLAAETVGLDEMRELFAALGPLGAATVLRPRVVEALLEQGASAVASLAPWLEVHAPLTRLMDLLKHHSPVLMLRAPEGLPPQDGLRPHRLDVLAAGWLSPSLIAVRADDREFTSWWSAELRRRADSAPETWRQRAYVTGSALTAGLEDAPQRFTRVGFIGDPGWAVSVWNLHARPLRLDDGAVLANETPLRLFDFTGFRPDRPHLLARVTRDSALAADTGRARPVNDAVLLELCRAYAKRVLASGWAPPESPPPTQPELPDGVVYDALVARLHELAAAEGEDVLNFDDPGAGQALVTWLAGPAESGGDAGITRYLHALYATREDLRRAFPNLDGPDADAFARWAWEHGQAELSLSSALLPPRPTAAAPAVRVVGHMRDALGLGQAARAYVRALTEAGVSVSTRSIDIDPDTGGVGRDGVRVPFDDSDLEVQPTIDLVCVNGDRLRSLAAAGVEEVLDANRTIGVWGWEVDTIPADWLAGFELVDEIWVYSSFVAGNLAQLSPVPVVPIPPPVVLAANAGGVTLPDGFTFLFMFDYLSTVSRKNPAGLIEAFTSAFAADEGPRLVLKTVNQPLRPEEHEALRERAGDRPDIAFLDGYLSEPAKTALLDRADCYISLHRSEGFGLALAESMLLGKPVIATAYSGNLDFMTVGNSYLVDWRPTRVGPEVEIYPASGLWADPDVEHAAALMRRVWERPAEARAKGRRAKEEIDAQLSPNAAGARALARLNRLTAEDRRSARHPWRE